MEVGVGYFLKGSLMGARPRLLVMTHQTRPWDSHLQSLENGKVWVPMLFASRRATRFSLGASWILCRLSLPGSLSTSRHGSGPTLPHDSAGSDRPPSPPRLAVSALLGVPILGGHPGLCLQPCGQAVRFLTTSSVALPLPEAAAHSLLLL